MLTMDEAMKIAKTKKTNINHCVEYTNAFMFSYEDDSDGGDPPIVIMKDSGKIRGMIEYAISPDKEFVREINI